MFGTKSKSPTGSGGLLIPSVASQKLDLKFGPPRTARTMKMLASRSGHMTKRNEQGKLQHRFVALVPHTFLYYYDNDHSNDPKGIIDLEIYESITVEETGDGSMIKIASESPNARAFYFKTDEIEDTSEWISALKNNRYFTIEKQRDEYHNITKQVSPHVQEQADTIQSLNDENHEQKTKRRHSLSSIKKWMEEISVAQTEIDRIQDVDEGIKVLKKEVKKNTSFSPKNESLINSQYSSLETENKLLVKENLDCKSRLELLEQENKQLNVTLKKESIEKNDEIATLKQDLSSVQARYDSTVEVVEQENNNLKSEKKKLVAAYKEVSKGKDDYKKDNKKLNIALQVYQQKLQTLEQEKAGLEERLNMLQENQEANRYSDSTEKNDDNASQNIDDKFHSKRHSSIIFDNNEEGGMNNGAFFDALSPKSHHEDDGEESVVQNIDGMDSMSVVSNGYYSVVSPNTQIKNLPSSPKTVESPEPVQRSFFGKVLNMLTDVDQLDDLLFPQPVVVMPEDHISHHRVQYIQPEPIFGSSTISSPRSPQFAGSMASYEKLTHKEFSNSNSSKRTSDTSPNDKKDTQNLSQKSPLQYQQSKVNQNQLSHYSINPGVTVSPFLDNNTDSTEGISRDMYCTICGGIAAGPRHSTCKCPNPSLQDKPLTQAQLDLIKSRDTSRRTSKSSRGSFLQLFRGKNTESNEEENNSGDDVMMQSGSSLKDVTAFESDDVSVLTQDMTLMTDIKRETSDQKPETTNASDNDNNDKEDDVSVSSRRISVTEIDFDDIHRKVEEDDNIIPAVSKDDNSPVKSEVSEEEISLKKSTRMSLNPLATVNQTGTAKKLDEEDLYSESNTHLYRGSSIIISKPHHEVKHFNGSSDLQRTSTPKTQRNEVMSGISEEGSKSNEDSTRNSGEIKVETTKVEATQVEATKVETTKVEATEVEATKVEATEVETTKVETTKVETTKVETTKVEATKVEATKVEATKVEATKVETTEEQKVVIPEDNKINNSTTDFFNPLYEDQVMDLPVNDVSIAPPTPKKSQRKSVIKRLSSISNKSLRKSLSPTTSPKLQKPEEKKIQASKACGEFDANPFKKDVCKTCQHKASEHY